MFCCESDCQAWAIVTLFFIKSWLVGIIFCLQSTFYVCNKILLEKWFWCEEREIQWVQRAESANWAKQRYKGLGWVLVLTCRRMRTKKLKFHPKLKQERKMKLMCVQLREFQLCAAGTIFSILIYFYANS